MHIAVRDLVAFVLRRGDLKREFSGPSRAVEAIRAHQRIQQSRPPGYRAEVPVGTEVTRGDVVLMVGGRIDGVFERKGEVVIEEIKTTTREPADLDEDGDPLHWGQVRSYAYLYGSEKGLPEVVLQLTYCHLDTGKTRQFQKTCSLDQLACFFEDLVTRYLAWAVTVTDWHRCRNESISRLDFPYARYRAGQREMAVHTYRTIRDRSQLMIQAATGIGKTMGVLFPAAKALGEGLCHRFFFLTARTTGRQVAESALEDMRRGGLRLKSLTLTARDKVCFHPDGECTAEACEFARGYYDRLIPALEAAFRHDAFTREMLEDFCREHTLCPFFFSLALSRWCDAVICDYNYAFDPRVYLRHFFLEDSGDSLLLIDEAHNLAERSRDMFSAVLFKQAFLDVRRRLGRVQPRIHRTLGSINALLVAYRRRCLVAGGSLAEAELPKDLVPLLVRFSRQAEALLTGTFSAAWREPLLELYFTVSGFLRVAEQFDESYATCLKTDGRELEIRLFCMDPSRQLALALARGCAAVFFSATLTPRRYFGRIFGCGQNTPLLDLPSPFPPGNLGVFIADRVSTLYRRRSSTAAAVAGMITTLVGARRGNYLVFFPSYEYLALIHAACLPAFSKARILVQQPDMNEDQREAFVAGFRHGSEGTLVGFAVLGGVFGEGIDLVGDRLSGAIIVGVGLPGISQERELIRACFEETDRRGFEFAYLYPGINRVLQAAGRVIRTTVDRGVVLLIDHRYGGHRYSGLLPAAWRPRHVANPLALAGALKRFWGDCAA
jgi:DNA excision repair protein ERCC-2